MAKQMRAAVHWILELPAKSSTALFCTFLTLQNNHTGQHAWPDLFLGRRLKGGW